MKNERYLIQIKEACKHKKFVNYASFKSVKDAMLCKSLTARRGVQVRILDRQERVYIKEVADNDD